MPDATGSNGQPLNFLMIGRTSLPVFGLYHPRGEQALLHDRRSLRDGQV